MHFIKISAMTMFNSSALTGPSKHHHPLSTYQVTEVCD